jgi:hypothetical protein
MVTGAGVLVTGAGVLVTGAGVLVTGAGVLVTGASPPGLQAVREAMSIRVDSFFMGESLL